jgi:hypothetical protein
MTLRPCVQRRNLECSCAARCAPARISEGNHTGFFPKHTRLFSCMFGENSGEDRGKFGFVDCPTVPDPRKPEQKYYGSFIAKLRFAASCIRFDMSFTLSLLARFCASAGPSHCAALHHLMEYLEGFPSLKLTYCLRTGVVNGLSIPVAQHLAIFFFITGVRFFGA